MRLYDYAASANCFKVRLLCSLLGLPYERVPVDIFGGGTLTDAFARLNPARETPVLELDDGTLVTQSNAILWLLAEGTPFLPSDPVGRAQVVQWLSFEQEWVMNGVGGARFRLLTGRDPEAAAARRETGEEGLRILEGHLAGRDTVVGARPSIADVSLYAYTHVAGEAGLDLAGYPAIRSWLAAVETLDGFVADLEPYPGNARPGAGRSTYDS